jgi:putative SOS response-associated peptidase YedK
MCYFVSVIKSRIELEKRFNAKFTEPEKHSPLYFSSAFELPELPFIKGETPGKIDFIKWGLIPRWVKGIDSAERIRYKTFNARFETIFEKPSFKHLILNKRGLLLVDGFFEWKEINGSKIPYYIKLKSTETFSLGGIYEYWENPDNAEIFKTFSIITVPANQFMGNIHNIKKRMPLILNKKNERSWLDFSLTKRGLQDFVMENKIDELSAYPVDRRIKKIGNRKEVLNRFEYNIE